MDLIRSSSKRPAIGCLFLAATILLASAHQLEAQHPMTSQIAGDSATPTVGRQLRQYLPEGWSFPYAPECEKDRSVYCKQDNSCLPGSYSLDNATWCSCCRPFYGDTRQYYCGAINCQPNFWGEAVSFPIEYRPFTNFCNGKWMKCNACPNNTYSPMASDSPYDCKSFTATSPTCYLLKNFSNPDVQPFPGMYFWPLNYTELKLQRLSSGPCAGHGLPVQVCLASNQWSGPNATLYQMWFIMEDGTRLSPYRTAGTNRGNYVIGFMPTSNSTCKWAQRNSLFYRDGPTFEIYGTQQCTTVATNTTRLGVRRFQFMPPPEPYCTPNLVVV